MSDRTDTTRYVFEGHDCAGKDYVRREFDHYMDFGYVTHVRDIISCYVYDLLVDRDPKNILTQLENYNKSGNTYIFIRVSVDFPMFKYILEQKGDEPISNVREYESFPAKYDIEKESFKMAFDLARMYSRHAKLERLFFWEFINNDDSAEREAQYDDLIRIYG